MIISQYIVEAYMHIGSIYYIAMFHWKKKMLVFYLGMWCSVVCRNYFTFYVQKGHWGN